jgi:redox-sensitive bicupin YhaK (pirin superfamily)
VNSAPAIAVAPRLPAVSRPLVARTRGGAHGGIVRLASPSDLGELIKPFVFLDAFDVDPATAPRFGWHPHSGIATVTVILEGRIGFAETTGRQGTLDAGGVEWMRAAGGVWHSGNMEGDRRVKGFQLWIALGPELEGGPAQSYYLNDEDVPADGPARVVLGRHGEAASRIPAPAGINYLNVQLKAGERWTYQPPPGHNVAWIALQAGVVSTPERVTAGELAVFNEGNGAISFEALDAARFVLGSAVKHPHDLVLGHYSVHTSPRALAKGEAEIRRIARDLVAQGRLNAAGPI